MRNSGDGYFRASAGAMVIDADKRVLALRRKDVPEEAWQMPQGGIGFDESPAEAAWRELREETGLSRADLELLASAREWIVYELPERFRSTKVGWGQAQRWFLFRALPGAEIRPDGREFDAFDWFTSTELVRRVVEFRQPAYRQVFSEFAHWL